MSQILPVKFPHAALKSAVASMAAATKLSQTEVVTLMLSVHLLDHHPALEPVDRADLENIRAGALATLKEALSRA